MVDAYQDITIPFQMSTVEFFSLVKNHLKDNGVMVVNMNMKGTQEGDINEYLSDTIASVFPSVKTVEVEGSTNLILFASENEGMLQELQTKIETLDNTQLKELMCTVEKNCIPYQAGNYIMTDDKAPVELLGMKVIDQLIQEEVSYYKKIYKEDGIKGLLEQL